jgi:hypothetical protein
VDVLGSSAAALAAASVVAKTYKPEKTEEYLRTATALYALAEKQLKAAAATEPEEGKISRPSLSYCGGADADTGLNSCQFKVKAPVKVPLRPATEPAVSGYM